MAYKKPENVPGLIRNGDGLFLESMAGMMNSGECIIEIGPFTGKSTCFLARGVNDDDIHVFSIDPWEYLNTPISGNGLRITETRAEAHKLFRENVKKCGFSDIVTEFHGFSEDAAASWNNVMPIGLIYVDANHKYAAVKEDIRLWAPKLAICGYMIFDDYNSPQVQRAVRELVQGSKDEDALQYGHFIFANEHEGSDRFAVLEKVG